jgi:hypothetical protein
MPDSLTFALEKRTVTRTEWFTSGVRGISAASLLSDLGHEVPTALLPRFITSLGGSADRWLDDARAPRPTERRAESDGTGSR